MKYLEGVMKAARNAFKSASSVAVALVGVVLGTSSGSALAAIDISTELAAAGADIASVVAGVGGVIIVGALLWMGYKFAIRVAGR